MQVTAFDRFAGSCAILAGVCGFMYSLAFIVIARSSPALGAQLSALFLGLSGLLATPALVGLYGRLRQAGEGFALLALGLGLTGALGATVHGGYDLANVINTPVADAASAANLPSQIDPRGLLTFGVAGLAVLVFAWLMRQGRGFPRSLGYLGYVLAVLLVIIYLGRLIVLKATDPLLLVPALLAGFIVNPVWYYWLGLALRQGTQASAMTAPGAAGARR
jgi:hypothetical protein